MQKNIKFLSILFSIFLSINSFSKEIISNQEAKSIADSLFQSKKYVDAKLIYDELYFKREVKSNDLILKQSYINEGLKKFHWSIYFLEQYLLIFPDDEKTISKIHKIAEEQNFYGYKNTDIDYLITYLKVYSFETAIILILIIVSLFIFNRINKNKISISFILICLIVIGFSFFFQKINSKNFAIITSESLLMKEPSAAGEFYKKIKPGHKVIIVDQIDIWTKIIYNDIEVYTKNKNISKI